MALFKILKGKSENLPKTYTEGYCYVTTDEHKLYIDSNGLSVGRFALNAEEANYLSTSPDAAAKAYVKLNTTNSELQLVSNNTSYPLVAESAAKLSTSAGSDTQPVYFSNGKPIATSYTLGKSVPSNAVFTDTVTPVVDNLTSTSTTSALSANQGKVLNDKMLPRSAGESYPLTGPLGLTENVNYGDTLPEGGFEGQLFFVEEESADLLHRKVVSTTLNYNSWSSSVPYTQTITVAGISSDSLPHITLNYDSTLSTAKDQRTNFGYVSDATSGAGTITFKCFDSKPAINLPIIIEFFY